MHYLSAYTLMNKFLLCSEKLLQIDCIYHLFKNNYSLTCVCVFFVVPSSAPPTAWIPPRSYVREMQPILSRSAIDAHRTRWAS